MSVEEIIAFLQTLDPLLVYAAIFTFAFIENLFPPSPSDTLIVFGGSLAGLSQIGIAEAWLSATLGSTLGFVVMYKIGDWFGHRIIDAGKITFIPLSAVSTVEEWFRKYGYWIIVANRFLSGTRAVVSFFAGMSNLNLGKTTVLCFISALAWNGILIWAGYALGNNWERIGFYLSTYSEIVTGIIIVVVLLLAARFIYQRGKSKK